MKSATCFNRTFAMGARHLTGITSPRYVKCTNTFQSHLCDGRAPFKTPEEQVAMLPPE